MSTGIGCLRVVVRLRSGEPAVLVQAETSASTRMSRRGRAGDHRLVEITVWLDRVDPPEGSLCRCDADRRCLEELRFTGWLGLLRALDELIRRDDAAPEE